jgi:hypothetical protein
MLRSLYVIHLIYHIYPICQVLVDFLLPFGYIKHMPSEKPKILLIVDDQLIERIDDFRFSNRINTRSEAIRRLIDEALKKYEKKPSKK